MDEVVVGPPSQPDNVFRKVFWPSADGAGWTAAFGFAVCVAIGAYVGYADFSRGQTNVVLFDVLLYGVGGVGILRRSLGAAVLVWGWLALGQAGNLLMGLSLMPISTTSLVLLIGTLRACWIGRRAPVPAEPERPVRSLTRQLWEMGRFPFFLVAGTMVLASLYGTVEAIHDHGFQRVESLEK